MDKNIRIGDFVLSDQHPCFIIAEAGVNHNGSVETAIELIHKAKETGADCVKFQTFRASSVITKEAPKAAYQLKVTDKEESQFDMLKKLELSAEDFKVLRDECVKTGIIFLSTPYNKRDVDLLNALDVDAFKIASGQIIELSFLEYVAKCRKPVVLSTGMSNLAEIDEAIHTIRNTGNDQIVLLQCTTNYPSSIQDANIRAMTSMGDAFDVLMGYSDHVPENYACYAAVARGAKVIEKHFTLDKEMPGPDHKASLNPEEFRILVHGIRMTEESLGKKIKEPTAEERKNITGMRRSIVSAGFISKGTVINESMLEYKRPATGISPNQIALVLNKKAAVDIPEDTILTMDMIEW